MARTGPRSDLPDEELRRLLSAWCDGWIEAADLDRLQTALRESRSARATYFAFMSVHAGVHGEIAAVRYLDSIPSKLDDAAPHAGRRAVRPWTRVAWAAAALVAAGLAWAVVRGGMLVESAPLARRGAEVARIVDEAPDSEWSLDHDGSVTDKAIRVGDMIRVARGKVKMRFASGTVLTLHGPALFEVVSAMKGRALLGRLTAKIAEGAEGYAVLTPRATVIDLGTELGIEVDDAGATDVVVFEGAVDLKYRSQQTGSTQQRRLVTGEAMHMDAYGTISRVVSITNQRFSDDVLEGAGGAQRPATVTKVRDNIQRETAWNYYEIVRGGMGEDARAYVDRTAHEWNGIDERGMPAYLVGGDYVKMFNNDKCRRDIEIIVTLDAPCHLYVLFDDRIPAPAWLRESFRNTGDKIGVDVGPWVYNGVPSRGAMPGVGPGVSVDDVLSVWIRRVDKAGPVRLGATETPHDDLNMYGIVVTPLDRASQPAPPADAPADAPAEN